MSQHPPGPRRSRFGGWITDALTTSLDARPPELEASQVDSKLCEKCRRDISREVGSFCPFCGQQRPQRLNLALQDFVPLCSDCGYDLSGLADGNCPECNKYFEVERLRIAWAVKQGSATSKYDRAKAIYIIALLICTFGTCAADDYPTFSIVMLFSVLIPYFHYKHCPNIAVQGGHILLLAMIPIFGCALRISFNDVPIYGQSITLVIAICLASFSLWAAPLKSALVIGTAISIPLFVVGAMYLFDGVVARMQGTEWTSIEGPVHSRWGALHTHEAITGGSILCSTSILLLIISATFSRRILLQLRSRANQAPPTVRPTSIIQT